MTDPYRDSSAASSRRVLARKSAGDIAFHMALALAGIGTPALAWYRGDAYPALFVLAFIAFPAGSFALVRSIHAWSVPHAIEIDDRGLRFAWGETIGFVPWLRRLDREVSWTDLLRVHTRTLSTNGWSSTWLVVTTREGSFEVPDARFDRSAELVQRDILDAIDRARERPIGSASAFACACRERFAEPLRLVASPWPVLGAFAFFVPFMAFPVWLATATPSTFTYGFAGVAVLVFGWILGLIVSGWWSGRVLELHPDALALGPTLASARRIPWDSIRTVRRDVTNGKTTGVEIVQDDGTRTTLRSGYRRSLDELAEMIDPSRHGA